MLILFTFTNEADRDKFHFLYERYKALMLSKAYGILKDYALAEDAVSEAYIRLYKNIHKIDDPVCAQSIAFLGMIVRNSALTILSKRNRIQAEALEDDWIGGGDIEYDILSKLSQEHIYRMMERLNEEYRSVFLLKYAYDMSHREIAKMLDISENNVTVRIHRAKKKLADMLVKEGYRDER